MDSTWTIKHLATWNSDHRSNNLFIVFILTWETPAVRKYNFCLLVSLFLFLCLGKPPTFNSNLKLVIRWLLQDENPFYRGIGRQRGRGFGALEQVSESALIPSLRYYILPAAIRVGVNLLEFVVPEVAEVFSAKNFSDSCKEGAKKKSEKTIV